MGYAINIEVELHENDKALLNAVNVYLEKKYFESEETSYILSQMMKYIYEMIAMDHGVHPATLEGLKGEVHNARLIFDRDTPF